MSDLLFGDIVIIKFPFTNSQNVKRRPALVIKDSLDGDIIVCRITSQQYDTAYDVEVKYWTDAGLKLPSVIRVHKIATLDKLLIEMVIGKVSIETKTQVEMIISSLTDTSFSQQSP